MSKVVLPRTGLPLTPLLSAGFTALRAYAISGRSLPLAVVIVAFSLVPIAVNIVRPIISDDAGGSSCDDR